MDGWPNHTDHPPPWGDRTPIMSGHKLQRLCVNRHDGAQYYLFTDWSARKVLLKQLWTLKWHRQFDTTGRWAAAGGVQPDDWPRWMAGMKDAF